MSKRISRSLLCIGVIAVLALMLASQAGAATCATSKTSSSSTCCAWKTTSSGYTYCALWCTGSELFTNIISGVGGNIFGDCSTSGVCPETSNEAYGTVNPTTGLYDPNGPCNTDLGTLDPDCAIKGYAYCQNNGGNSKFKNPKVQGNPFLVTGVLGLDVPLVPQDCDKQGKCTTNGKLEANLSAIHCQNDNWTALTFTASEFKAKSCFCPGGFDNETTPRCCATTDRNNGTCVQLWGSGGPYEGTPTCMIALCTVDLSTYNPLTNPSLGYDCQSQGQIICGGDSTTPCP